MTHKNNKNKLIALAFDSPHAPQEVKTKTVASFLGTRANNVLFPIYFAEVSGLTREEVKYTILNFEYPAHIEEEKQDQVAQSLLSKGIIPYGYNKDGSKIIFEELIQQAHEELEA